jgi:hypothetical protein
MMHRRLAAVLADLHQVARVSPDRAGEVDVNLKFIRKSARIGGVCDSIMK